MELTRETQHATNATGRKCVASATTQRRATAATSSPARRLQQRLGNRGTQAFALLQRQPRFRLSQPEILRPPHQRGAPAPSPQFSMSRTEPCTTGSSHSFDFTVYQDEVRVGSGRSRPWRNNNPGTLRYRSSDDARFAVQALCIDRQGFAIFANEQAGRRALSDWWLARAAENVTLRAALFRF